MALEKIDILALGRGSLVDNANAVIALAANNLITTWLIGSTYAQYNVVEYSGKVYRSKVAGNIGNQPDTSPNQWETLYSSPKDGDIAFVYNGAASTVLQRKSAGWSPLTDSEATVALVDGQASPADAVVFLGSAKAFAKIEYTIRRGSGHGRKRHGVLDILNDTTVTVVEYAHQFNEIGSDVNVPFTLDSSGTNVRLRYTSANEGVAIELKFTLKGWS